MRKALEPQNMLQHMMRYFASFMSARGLMVQGNQPNMLKYEKQPVISPKRSQEERVDFQFNINDVKKVVKDMLMDFI